MLVDKNKNKFLQFRERPVNLDKIESEYNCKFPPVYRAFITSFLPYFGNITFMSPESNQEEDFTSFIYSSISKNDYSIDDDELSFECFIEPDELFENSSTIEYVRRTGLLPISYHGFNGGLLVGLKDDNLDKIYFTHDSEEIKFIANNVFELIEKIHIVTVLYDHPNLDVNKLYKNWGEDFWRIRNRE
ncbi:MULTISPECIES: SMI1/KNR4 family protein [Tenacibaculum]|uniref:SMI1/KNR4 family protein n=1 Tax=Tenacibaculum TaxID=104267 RepID=UPI00064A53CA|nr:SMI1/KNR4 family protein [Tenacibaculum mesophilum]KAF9660120.1 SMI1/KNR4 family protein [Tenacibaculum mesophilum]